MRNYPQADFDILKHILRFCNNIEQLFHRFGSDFTVFQNDMAFKDAVSMNILQIGEIVGHLSEEYRNDTQTEIPWRSIKNMRNLFAHSYGTMNVETIWSTAVENIPQLKAFCLKQIESNDSDGFCEQEIDI